MAAPTVLTLCYFCVRDIKVCVALRCVGVDSSLLIHGLGYTEDIADDWVWHCTTCY